MHLRRIVPGVHTIEGLKSGRAFLVEGDDRSLAIVDTSTAGVGPRILRAIADLDRGQLRAIIATHYHYDHTGNADALRRATGARLHVHPADVPYVNGTVPWMRASGPSALLERFVPPHYALNVDAVVTDGDVLPYAGGLRVVHTPGHTPGHIALYAPDRGILFAGDAFMNVLGLHLPMAMATHDMDSARRSVRALAQLDYDVALPGHGAPILSRAGEKVRLWSRAWL